MTCTFYPRVKGGNITESRSGAAFAFKRLYIMYRFYKLINQYVVGVAKMRERGRFKSVNLGDGSQLISVQL